MVSLGRPRNVHNASITTNLIHGASCVPRNTTGDKHFTESRAIIYQHKSFPFIVYCYTFFPDHYSVPAHINETAIQTLRIMKEMMYGSHITIATRKSSPYKESFNQIISSLYETGIMLFWEERMTERYMSRRLQIAIMQSVILSNKEGPTQLMVDHLQGAFVILSLGLALATVVFTAEMACSTIKCHHERFKDKFRYSD